MNNKMIKMAALFTLLATSVGCAQAPGMSGFDLQGFKKKNGNSINQSINQNAAAVGGNGGNGGAGGVSDASGNGGAGGAGGAGGIGNVGDNNNNAGGAGAAGGNNLGLAGSATGGAGAPGGNASVTNAAAQNAIIDYSKYKKVDYSKDKKKRYDGHDD